MNELVGRKVNKNECRSSVSKLEQLHTMATGPRRKTNADLNHCLARVGGMWRGGRF